ncbi:MAG TPA: hypothetical protein VGM59_11680 [Dongiaceae bacterium]|jgi:hypothetical protein
MTIATIITIVAGTAAVIAAAAAAKPRPQLKPVPVRARKGNRL